ncbi:unnamed protein product [Polarella glacialis]|uniref:Uncharacterized protein n=1 Tax=Polarella glacialis TaxID=89957 RepID=A0A813GI81_POLGL|nr:unnamed protein product [Polarella glacialis]
MLPPTGQAGNLHQHHRATLQAAGPRAANLHVTATADSLGPRCRGLCWRQRPPLGGRSLSTLAGGDSSSSFASASSSTRSRGISERWAPSAATLLVSGFVVGSMSRRSQTERRRSPLSAQAEGKSRAASKQPTWKRRKNAELYKEFGDDSEGAATFQVGATSTQAVFRDIAENDLAGSKSSAEQRPGGVLQLKPGQKKPEVLAPAGGWPQLRAAVNAGADAVYFGLSLGLNARARAANFSEEELPQVMDFLRARGVPSRHHSQGTPWKR